MNMTQRIPETDPIMNDPMQADVYAQRDTEGPFREFIHHFQRAFPDESIEGRVLDLGCGQGEVTFPFLRAYPRCHIDAIDAADEMIRHARRKQAALQLTGIHFSRVRLPGEAPPHIEYDCVISNSLLHHLSTGQLMWQTVRQTAGVQAPVFVMDLMRPRTKSQATSIVAHFGRDLHEIVRRDFFHSLLAAYTPCEVQAQLDDAGFRSFTVQPISDIQMIIYGRMPL